MPDPVQHKSDPADARVDELYREHPDGFVKRRDELARELRAEGDREESDRVKKLRRPSVAAWLINRTALESPADLEEFADASAQLEAAQREMLEGSDQAAAHWRSAAERERRAAGAVVDTAGSLARAAGHPPGERAIELVRETLRAATADPELRGRVLRGRLEREQSASTLGTLAGVTPRPRDAASATGRQAALARRELRRLEEQLAKAEAREQRQQARVDEAAEALREEKSRLSETRRETADLRRRVKAAQRNAGG